MTTALDPRRVQLWQWHLDAPGVGGEADRALLSAAECARADRFVVPHGRRRFTAARAALRRVVAEAAGQVAAGLALEEGGNGKPFLPGGPEFNLSHTGALALFALAAFPVGVDVEAVRPVADGVAELVFSPEELCEWGKAADRQAAFYRGWTRKEAVLKARGGSLAEMRGLSVSLGAPAVLRGEPAWQIVDVPMAPGTAAALAAPCRGWSIAWQT